MSDEGAVVPLFTAHRFSKQSAVLITIAILVLAVTIAVVTLVNRAGPVAPQLPQAATVEQLTSLAEGTPLLGTVGSCAPDSSREALANAELASITASAFSGKSSKAATEASAAYQAAWLAAVAAAQSNC